ncbi:arginine--tRNA ligase [Desulfurella multipotens]|uniref:arginine--tRNA ligase n=1 Tax=Desulfurella TaxID=33001 RepID=UPI000CC380A8|nr:arginine--tRNA ligase [Desulfurella multipotens]PMP64350.1 MAG: arginine--tRNA ligase [Desulfurella multipotens]
MKFLIKPIIDKYLENKSYEYVNYSIDYPPEAVFGDYSTNLAMVLAKKIKQNPINIAQDFKAFCENSEFSNKFKIKIEKPGFINFFLTNETISKEFLTLYQKKETYFQFENMPKKKIQIEFVSANPTGPLHIGHGRGAAIGDSLARILNFLGYNVVREYYINDAGYQMYMLGLSTFLRYKELLGQTIEFPQDAYQGEYIKDIARDLIKTYQDNLLSMDNAIDICLDKAKNTIMNDILHDMENFKVTFDVFFSESSLFQNNEVEHTIELLKSKGFTYEKDGALWLKTTQFNDDKDRVLIKQDGKYTYLSSDIAYHKNKFLKRGFDMVIDIWGSDHHGYVARLKAALEALGIDSQKLIVLLVQFVNLIQENNKISMSTRKATYIELKELINEIGTDAARFIFVSKSINSHLDIDISLLKKKSMDNPVYYIQYAHARIMSILEKSNCNNELDESMIKLLQETEEINLIKSLLQFKEYLHDSAKTLEPYLVTKSLLIIAEKLHQFYNKHKVIGENKDLSCARVGLIKTVAFVLALGLSLIGIQAKNKM